MYSQPPDKSNLLNKITDAFRSVPYPGDGNIIVNRQDLESLDIARAFRGMEWQKVPFETVFQHRDSLPFFSPAAFRYFLPAYMCHSILHYNDSDTLPEYIVYQLTPPRSNAPSEEWRWFNSNVGELDAKQRKAIVMYLQYMCIHHSADFPHGDPKDALEMYWAPEET